MYCPNCGSNNQAEMKFCTRCGTDLGVVSGALSKRAGSVPQLDERMMKIIKEYYKGRRDTITGVVLIPAAVKLIAMLVLLGLPPIGAFFVVSWMIFWGIAALAGGLGSWMSAAGEMRALGYEPPRSKLLVRAESLLHRGSGRHYNYSTGPTTSPMPVSGPVTVTDQTTRTLEERAGLLDKTQ